MKNNKIVYHGNTPHFEPVGATFFVTCSLKGAIPKAKPIDRVDDGPTYLSNPDTARILLARIESYHMRYYKLLALTIMPNHFQMLIDTSVQIKSIYEPDTIPDNYIHLSQIMNKIKEGSSQYINHLRGISGEQVWEKESYIIYMSNEKMVRNKVAYILNKPVKAGIVKKYEEHPFTIVQME